MTENGPLISPEQVMSRMVELGLAVRSSTLADPATGEKTEALVITAYGKRMTRLVDPARMGRILRGDEELPADPGMA